MPSPRFTPNTLRFLRALKRNNNRDWFKARKDEYEKSVRGPMVEVIERLAADFRRFAPELVVSPQKSLYRIYRDTRFSDYRFVAGREFPATLATSPEFYPTLLRTFRALMPLVRFLNEPLI